MSQVPDEQLDPDELAEKKRQRFQKNMAEGRARARQKKVEEQQKREQEKEEEDTKYRSGRPPLGAKQCCESTVPAVESRKSYEYPGSLVRPPT